MERTEQAQIKQLLDREAIRECLFAYCRGIDRRDEDALRSSYWSDATDHHGPWVGSASSFIDSALKILKSAPRMVHMLGNISIVLKGDCAAVESYFQAFQQEKGDNGELRTTTMCGRYVDRFEKRNDEWRIAARMVVFDWIRHGPGVVEDDASNFGVRIPNGQHRPDDPWYALLAQAPFS